MKENAIEQISFRDQLIRYSQGELTGRLDVKYLTTQSWSFYLHQGHLIWAKDNLFPARRWYRLISQACPHIDFGQVHLRRRDIFECWDYHLLSILSQRGKLNSQQIVAIIKQTCAEILFDVFQVVETVNFCPNTPTNLHEVEYLPKCYPQSHQGTVSMQINLGSQPSTQLISPRHHWVSWETNLTQVQQEWQNWYESGLVYCSPNLVPLIKDRAKLQQKTTPRAHHNLIELVNGQRTIRELAHLSEQDLLTFTTSVVPYVCQSVMGLVKVDDLPKPEFVYASKSQFIFRPRRKADPKGILVACIDENSQTCLNLETILLSAGYQCVAIQNSLQALPLVIQHNPKIILLNLTVAMPVTHSSEICGQIRRIARFQETPIIIMGEHWEGKIPGATEFFSQPMDGGNLLAMLRRYSIQN